MDSVIYACDVGSTRTDSKRRAGSGFGWVRLSLGERESIGSGTSVQQMTAAISQDLGSGRSVALGFECPLFIPIPIREEHLCTGREGEGNRAWAAPAGLAVTTLGLQQSTWVLTALASHKGSVHFTVDAADWPPRERQVLFCWEAFVSGLAHSDTHLGDALTAARAFEAVSDLSALRRVQAYPRGTNPSASTPMSVIGAAALWSGWSNDVAALKNPCVVIKPELANAVGLHGS